MKQHILGIDASRYALPHPTGVEIYTQKVIDGLLDRPFPGIRIRLYCAHPFQAEALKSVISSEHEIRLIQCRRLWTHLGLGSELRNSCPDLLFVPSHVLPFGANCPSVLVVHGLEAHHFPRAYSRFQRWYQHITTCHAVKNAARLVAVSHAVRNDLELLYSCPTSKIEVIYEGFDSQDIPLHDEENRELLPPGPYILHAGRLEERKNQFRLVEAFVMLLASHPDWNLALVGGNGYGASRIHALIAGQPSHVRSRIHILGHRSHAEVLSLMRHSEMFVYPSLAEGFGLPLLEAMALGTPVITSHGSALAEIGDDAVLMVDPLSSFEIFSAMRKIIDTPALCEELKKKGFNRVKHFSWNRCVDRLHQSLVSLLHAEA